MEIYLCHFSGAWNIEVPPRFLETCEPVCYITISFILLHYYYLLSSELACELHEFSSVIFRNEYEYQADVRGVVYFLCH